MDAPVKLPLLLAVALAIVATPMRGEETWWSLKPIVAGAATNSIDGFVSQALIKNNIGAQAEADRRTLIRRLYFDLHGLPPRPEEVKEFVADKNPKAYEKLVDRLLESPRYGERWARHWLDTIHFADTHG